MENLLTEKNVDPRGAGELVHLPDERARFVDAEKPDHPRAARRPAPPPSLPNLQPIRSRFRRGIDQERVPEFLEHCDQHNRSVRARWPRRCRPTPLAACLGDPTRDAGGVARLRREQCPQQSIDAVLRTDEQPFLLT